MGSVMIIICLLPEIGQLTEVGLVELCGLARDGYDGALEAGWRQLPLFANVLAKNTQFESY